MALAVTKRDLQRLLSGYPFTSIYGFRLHAITEGRCTLDVPFQVSFERPGGLVSGPVFMAAADVAMWLALLTRLGPSDRSVTATMTTTFLTAARNEDFQCTARVVKLGKRLVYGVAECVTKEGTLLTHHSLTYFRSDSTQEPAAPQSAGRLRKRGRRG